MVAWTDLLTAFGLVLVIEGAVYAFFPAGIRRACQWLQEWPVRRMRAAGLTAMLAGLAVVWMVRG
ncbi:MAG: DUF2065 domain-containing protein [Alphaproteobacteria bacterium]|nr:MAG: DUF2065 domain-containing protein [Alphaproteobacteria bacterium]